jgi:hypothetical protein
MRRAVPEDQVTVVLAQRVPAVLGPAAQVLLAVRQPAVPVVMLQAVPAALVPVLVVTPRAETIP